MSRSSAANESESMSGQRERKRERVRVSWREGWGVGERFCVIRDK